MKILVVGAGVIGSVYAWQLAEAGHDLTMLVRPGTREAFAQGIQIYCVDERTKPKKESVALFSPEISDDWSAVGDHELILVCVRAHQVDALLPGLATVAGAADILFMSNNWWGDEPMRRLLPAGRYLFGLSRLVGGWRKEGRVECIIFAGPQMSTMLGEGDGRDSSRLRGLVGLFGQAGLRPQVSRDILGWLATHYVEYLGAVGGIREAGSAAAFAHDRSLVRRAILATREGLDICRARGIDVKRSAPFNLRLYASPLWLIVPLGQMQYRAANIQQFFEENIANGMPELSEQYQNVVSEGRRLGVAIPNLGGFACQFGSLIE